MALKVPCPIWLSSQYAAIPNLDIISKVPSTTSILIMQRENDSQTLVLQAFLLQQRLTEVNHPDHILITYPNLGHAFYPSSQWSTVFGPIRQYVLADLYGWLGAHSSLSHSFAATAATSHIAASAYSTSSTNSSINKEISPQVKSFILNQIINKSKAAIVVGFVDPNGTRVFSFGNMSKSHNIPVNENTLFDIGSITKTFTTLLLADMIEQGIVNLTDPVEKYLPASVKVPEFNGHKITFEDLATHTSGLPEIPSNIWLNKKVGTFNPHYNASLLYQGLSNTKLTREPGTKFQYSSFGIGLLGYILSLKAGVPYEQLVKDRILNVLGMNDTKITLSQNEIENRFAVGHMGGKEISSPTIPTIMAGAGAFRSTASDLLKYVSANLGFLHTKLDDAIVYIPYLEDYLKAIDLLTINSDRTTLQKQVAELTEKSKEETYIIKGKLFEREKEVQTMQKKHEQDMKDLRKELEPLLVLKKTLEEQGLLKLS